jgi:ribosomal protein S18 acetylase RimI-like enzyme
MATVWLKEPGSILKEIAAISGPDTITNLYFTGEQLSELADQPRIEAYSRKGAALLWKKEAGFQRLYFRCSDLDALQNAIVEAAATPAVTIVSGLFDHPRYQSGAAKVLIASGFRLYRKYQRLSCSWPDAGLAVESPAVVREARLTESALLWRLIVENFDARAEQLPSLREIEQAVNQRTVLVAESGSRLVALLFYSRNGLTTTLWHLLVLPEYRRCGLGTALLREYARICADCRRFLLWVDCENAPAIRRYFAHGYQADGLQVKILIK